MAESSTPQVLIVGAGPTGLTLAGELTRRGVACRIIDKKSGPSVQSKALGVHARTLEMLERLELAAEMCRRGRKVRAANVYAGGKRLTHVEIVLPETIYDHILILPQSETEQLLIERLGSLGVSVEWEVELEGIDPGTDGVRAFLKHHRDGDRTEIATAPWLAGCGGAHSPVRHALGLPFHGAKFPESFYLADLTIDWDLPADEGHAFLSPDGFFLIIPLPEAKAYRVIINEPPGAGPARESPTLEDFQQWFDRRVVLPGGGAVRLSRPVWLSHFQIHRRIVPQLRHGRVFVLGDAAHIHSPAGGQGMNTSIQDAMNLAWKLALVIGGDGREALLDTFNEERHPVAKAVLEGTHRFTEMVTFRNWLLRLGRNLLIRFATSFRSVRRNFALNVSELAVNYRGSSLATADGQPSPSGPKPGERAPDAPVVDSREETKRLHQLFCDPRFTLLIFAGDNPSPERGRQLRQLVDGVETSWGSRVQAFVVTRDNTGPIGDGFVLLDRDGQAHSAYGAGTDCAYLIRPDGYVGYCCSPADGDKPVNYLLERVFARLPAPAG